MQKGETAIQYTNSTSSKQSMSIVSGGQVAIQKKFVTQSKGDGRSFPMPSEEFI